MINKYITGCNSGEWRLTLTECCDLHATAKPQSFNKKSAFARLLLNVNFLKCRHGVGKKDSQATSICKPLHFGFDMAIHFLCLVKKILKRHSVEVEQLHEKYVENC